MQYTTEYHVPNTECNECIWWKDRTVPVTKQAEVLSNALHDLFAKTV